MYVYFLFSLNIFHAHPPAPSLVQCLCPPEDLLLFHSKISVTSQLRHTRLFLASIAQPASLCAHKPNTWQPFGYGMHRCIVSNSGCRCCPLPRPPCPPQAHQRVPLPGAPPCPPRPRPPRTAPPCTCPPPPTRLMLTPPRRTRTMTCAAVHTATCTCPLPFPLFPLHFRPVDTRRAGYQPFTFMPSNFCFRTTSPNGFGPKPHQFGGVFFRTPFVSFQLAHILQKACI